MKLDKKARIIAILLVFTCLMIGCTKADKNSNLTAPLDGSGIGADESKKGETKTFTTFIAVEGKEVSQDNRMMNKIAQKIGAKAEVKYLTGQTPDERIKTMIAQGEYPDFIDGSDAMSLLVEAKALIPLDEYIDDYPNIKHYLSEDEWDQFRQDDGHIYYIPQFNNIQGEDMAVQHSDEAFWIQKRVLKWAGYPKLKTLDDYFGLIEAYLKQNPENGDGQKNIGFEILCDDWRYICLENPPQFLAGYPNDGCAIVNPQNGKASVYDTIPEAKQYYKKLCEVYNNGTIDPETFTLSYSQYIEKLSSGCVLGMVDQYWQFMGAQLFLYNNGMDDRTYVPLGIVADQSVTEAYRSPVGRLNALNGLGITVSCKDIKGALEFINDLLDPDIMTMRFWGEEGIDYQVDENGIFYRNEVQRTKASDNDWIQNSMCYYDYFPHYSGQLADGKNAVALKEQPGEYYASLSDFDKEVLDAYGHQKWTDFLNPVKENKPWFPLYTALTGWKEDTDYGIAKENMESVKREWLPKVIMSSVTDFEASWKEYMRVYHMEVNVKAYEKKLTEEVQKRIAEAKDK